MEKGELKTGQLLGIVEKNGKLIREYVAGFFGDEPIIKQRLLTPQEVRRYREDLDRGKREGKSESEAVRAASRPGASPAGGLGAPGLKKRPVNKPGMPVRTRPVGGAVEPQANPQASHQTAETRTPGSADTPRAARPVARQEMTSSAPSYINQVAGVNEAFLHQLIENETDKPNFNPANKQKALDTISTIGSPEMKIYRIGSKTRDGEGTHYAQKELLSREILGLPLWKPKAPEPEKQETPEASLPVVAEPASQKVDHAAAEVSDPEELADV